MSAEPCRLNNMRSHKLEIVKPGRGAWMAGCSCGQAYTTGGVNNNRYWTPSEVSTAKIRAMHAAHKVEVR